MLPFVNRITFDVLRVACIMRVARIQYLFFLVALLYSGTGTAV
jgi:hypothetical protein